MSMLVFSQGATINAIVSFDELEYVALLAGPSAVMPAQLRINIPALRSALRRIAETGGQLIVPVNLRRDRANLATPAQTDVVEFVAAPQELRDKLRTYLDAITGTEPRPPDAAIRLIITR